MGKENMVERRNKGTTDCILVVKREPIAQEIVFDDFNHQQWLLGRRRPILGDVVLVERQQPSGIVSVAFSIPRPAEAWPDGIALPDGSRHMLRGRRRFKVVPWIEAICGGGSPKNRKEFRSFGIKQVLFQGSLGEDYSLAFLAAGLQAAARQV